MISSETHSLRSLSDPWKHQTQAGFTDRFWSIGGTPPSTLSFFFADEPDRARRTQRSDNDTMLQSSSFSGIGL